MAGDCSSETSSKKEEYEKMGQGGTTNITQNRVERRMERQLQKSKQNRTHTANPYRVCKEGKEGGKKTEREKMSTGKKSRLEAHNSSQNSANVPVPFVSL